MAPVALASGRDGSLYIGDYNFIRKLASNREEVASILQLGYVAVNFMFLVRLCLCPEALLGTLIVQYVNCSVFLLLARYVPNV